MTVRTIPVSTAARVSTEWATTRVSAWRDSPARIVRMTWTSVFQTRAKTEPSAKIMSTHTRALVRVDSLEETVTRMTTTARPPPA